MRTDHALVAFARCVVRRLVRQGHSSGQVIDRTAQIIGHQLDFRLHALPDAVALAVKRLDLIGERLMAPLHVRQANPRLALLNANRGTNGLLERRDACGQNRQPRRHCRI